MSKRVILSLLLLLTMRGLAFAQTSLGITVIAAPVGAALSLNSYVWTIAFANDGTTVYQNDQQGTATVKSGTAKNFRIDFSSQNLGYVNQGTAQIPYSVKVTMISTNTGLVGTPAITAGYVQLTATQSISFNKKTPAAGIQFYVGMLINPVAGEFYISGAYTDTVTITYTAT